MYSKKVCRIFEASTKLNIIRFIEKKKTTIMDNETIRNVNELYKHMSSCKFDKKKCQAVNLQNVYRRMALRFVVSHKTYITNLPVVNKLR